MLHIEVNRLLDRVEKGLGIDRLRQETNGAGLSGPDLVRRIVVSTDENDREVRAASHQDVVEIEAGLAGHADVDDETGGTSHGTTREERIGRREELNQVTGRDEHTSKRTADRHIIVDKDDGRWRVGRGHADVARASGSVRWNVAPCPGVFRAQMMPPWPSTIDRAIDSPIPMPPGFVL